MILPARQLAILGAIAIQVIILTGMLVKASLPLWTGSEIQLRTMPVDPRSLFRGNYARLRYDISQIPASALPNYQNLRQGEVVYIALKENGEGIFEFSSAQLDEPGLGIFMKGRYRGFTNFGPALDPLDPEPEPMELLNIDYGIEAYFAPVEKALELERQLRSGGAIATVMVTAQGQPALKAISSPP